jgi:glycerol-3-phosphate dehydrogenase
MQAAAETSEAPDSGAQALYDLLIVGGGVNGCGIARDAAGRGLSVALCEMGDLAQGTSSASTKLFHGGLRYLEHYEFRLVRESLIERELLLQAMPHIAWPMRFVLPHHRGLRPAWLLRAGLFLYDHLGGRKLLPPTRTLNLRREPAGEPLKDRYVKGFEYSDCWVDDSRLVVLNARAAATLGATIHTRTKLVSARRTSGVWEATWQNVTTGQTETVQAKAIVNAAGPWVDQVLGKGLASNTAPRLRLVRGSHIVTRRLFDHDRCYIFQNSDGRIVFAIPYERDFTLIGTTDADHEGDPSGAVCTPEEADYLRAAVSEYLKEPIRPEDIVWTFSGVRPLYDDSASAASQASRDYMLEVQDQDKALPLVNVFGGKITTYRRLAEAVLTKLRPYFPDIAGSWTARVPLPGGDFPIAEDAARIGVLQAAYPFLDEAWATRLWRAYGTECHALLGDAQTRDNLGKNFGASLTEREVRWLIGREWAQTAEDVLWRRSKLGLRLDATEKERLAAWMRQATEQQNNPRPFTPP